VKKLLGKQKLAKPRRGWKVVIKCISEKWPTEILTERENDLEIFVEAYLFQERILQYENICE
jgi:hypothetical protein